MENDKTDVVLIGGEAKKPAQNASGFMAESEEKVARAIDEAKKAARLAGMGTGAGGRSSGKLKLTRPACGGLTSFALELEGLDSALRVEEIEKALESVPDVHASVIYATSTAWITAPDDIDPNTFIEILAGVGVTAYLTRSSLHRRAERLEVAERRLRMQTNRREPSGWRLRSLGIKLVPRPLETGHLEPGKSDGLLRSDVKLIPKEKEPTDVLFTARALITKRRLIVSLILTLPVLVLCYTESLQFPWWQWVVLGLSTPVVLWGAWPFHRAMVAGLRRGMSALDAASSFAIIASYLWSLSMLVFTDVGAVGWTMHPEWLAVNQSIFHTGQLFLDVSCGCTVLLLFGRLATRISSSSMFSGEESFSPHELVEVVQRKRGKSEAEAHDMQIQELHVGDDIVIGPDQVVPSDGNVIGGTTMVDPGISGGGSGEQKVKVGSFVYAGSVNRGPGIIKVRVQRTGSRTRLAAMSRWIAESSRYNNRSAQLATRTASWLVPWAISLSLIDFVLWWLVTGNLNSAFATALALLCGVGPVALALSTSIAMRLGIEASARRGILMRNADAVRSVSEVDTVLFNRVGTLGVGEMAVETVTADAGENPELVLRVAGALAMESPHPTMQALVRAAREARDAGTGGEEVPHWIDVSGVHWDADGNLEGVVTIPVADAEGTVSLKPVEARLWRPRDLSGMEGRIASAAVAGGTPMAVSWKGKIRGVITLYSKVKDDAADAISELESLGYETVMITRDTYPVARRFADNLGISKVLAGIAPGDKDSSVRSVHASGHNVALIGDESVTGCLRVADVGILMGKAESLDVDEADVVILRDDVMSVAEAMVLARRVVGIVDRNILLSWIYNLGVMVVSATGVLHPMASTVLMIASSLIIEARSNRVRSFGKKSPLKN